MAVKNALLPGFGGPMGRHAVPRGLWFNPLPWTLAAGTALFLVLFLRHVPCVQVDATNQINSYIRACYSDLQVTYLSSELGQGLSLWGGDRLLAPPLIVATMALVNLVVTQVLGLPVTQGGDFQQAVDASLAFFGISAVLLFVAFLVFAFAVGGFGLKSRRGWDSLLIAGCPIVLAVGLINWDLIPVAITAMALLQFSRGRAAEAGILLGVAACAGTMPIGVILAVSFACGLRGGGRAVAQFAGPAVLTFFVIQLPLLLSNFDAVYAFYHQEINKEASYGSLWYLAGQLGFNLRSIGSFAFVLLMLALAVLFAYLYVGHRRPRVGSLIAAVVLLTGLLGPAFPPQTALWLLLAVVIARPYQRELTSLTATQVVYYLAVWAWIGGALTPAQSGPFLLYYLAILARAGVEGYLLAEVISDMARPSRDAMRTPDVPDPLGGILNRGECLEPVVPVPKHQAPASAKPWRRGPFALEDIYRRPEAGRPEQASAVEGSASGNGAQV